MAVLYAYKKLSEMNKDERIRACYLHSCLKYVSGEKITNSSIRERFKIEPKNYPLASKIINETLTVKLIKPADPNNKSKRHSSYVPFWA
jgi:predicted HTH transcriptional regulator